MTDVVTSKADSKPTQKRACLYIRVSTAEQGEKQSPDVQRRDMLRWAEFHGYTVEPQHIYEDINASGASDINERENMPKLFEAAKKKEFDLVLVWKLDRFFRKTLYLLDAIEQLRKAGIHFIATQESGVDTTNVWGNFMLQFLGIIAEMERNNIMERTASGRQSAAKAGLWVGGRYPPYGYDVDPETQKMKINKAEEKIVKQVFDWFVNDGMTTYEIQQRLFADKVPTKADTKVKELKAKKKLKKEFRTSNSDCFWHEYTITRMLRQKAYTGTYYYGKRTRVRDLKTKKWITKLNPPEQWVPIVCLPIIGLEIWDKAQPRLKENKRLSSKNKKHDYLLSGKVECGLCRSSYIGYTKVKYKTANGVRSVVGEYPQYRCKKNSKAEVDTPCRNRQMSGAIMETRIWEEIRQLIDKPEKFLERVQKEETRNIDVEKLERRRQELFDDIVGLDKQYGRACDLYEAGMKYQGKGELRERELEIKKQKAEKQTELDEVCNLLMNEQQKKERLAAAKVIAKKFRQILEDVDDDFDTKTDVIRTFVRRVVIYPKEVRLELLLKRRGGGASGGSQPPGSGGGGISGNLPNNGGLLAFSPDSNLSHQYGAEGGSRTLTPCGTRF